jgi:hypothetical protein
VNQICAMYFRGHGVVPVVVRLITWQWWTGQKWSDVPAHVAMFWLQPDGSHIEIEAVVTGIRREKVAALPTGGVADRFFLPDVDGKGWAYASSQVGGRYGFEAAMATGLGSLPWWRALATRLWAKVGAGRTAPLHCSLLAQETMREAGQPVQTGDLPPSPNGQMLFLRTKQ